MTPCIKYFKGFIGCMGKMSYINIKLILEIEENFNPHHFYTI